MCMHNAMPDKVEQIIVEGLEKVNVETVNA